MPVVSSSAVIDVFLLAENRLLREALARVLNKKSDIRVVASVPFAPQVPARIAQIKPHVLLLDVAVSAFSDPELLSAVRSGVPGLKIVMIGMDPDTAFFLQCVRAGIAGFMLKDASAAEIAAAVRTVAYEGAVCPPQLCLTLFEHIASHNYQLPSYFGKLRLGLTRREQQLAQLIGHGLSNKEIASSLNLSEQTIKNHVHRMLRKLGASDRLAAVQVCREQGLVA